MPGAVRTRRAFADLARSRDRARGGPLRVVRTERRCDHPADGHADGPAPDPADAGVDVAYAIGRSVGTAVVRNRLRRRLRALMAELDAAGAIPPGRYLIGAAPAAATCSFGELRTHLLTALSRLP